jgi:acyl-CoA synthetase (AMP-forming)/AMP-acid ligase II
MMVSRELSEGFAQRYGIKVTCVYAMTENCAVSVLGRSEPVDKAPAFGRLRDDVSVQIANDDGRELPRGEVGQIRVRPNEPGMTMLGYYNMVEATIATTRDLGFHTGDRAFPETPSEKIEKYKLEVAPNVPVNSGTAWWLESSSANNSSMRLAALLEGARGRNG